MVRLPHWVITDLRPGFYDSESATAIEQTAKLYKAMQEFIDEYNKYVDEFNTYMETYESTITKNIEDFKRCITEMMLNHISCIDAKLDRQNQTIADAVDYMKANIYINTYKALEEMLQNGLIRINDIYDADAEDLDFTLDYGLIEEETEESEVPSDG